MEGEVFQEFSLPAQSSSLGLSTKDFPSSFPKAYGALQDLAFARLSSLITHSTPASPVSLLVLKLPQLLPTYLPHISTWFIPSPPPELCSNVAFERDLPRPTYQNRA